MHSLDLENNVNICDVKVTLSSNTTNNYKSSHLESAYQKKKSTYYVPSTILNISYILNLFDNIKYEGSICPILYLNCKFSQTLKGHKNST